MRYVATPSRLQALSRVNGLPDDTIGILPLWEQARVLVFALGKEAVASQLNKVVSQL